MSKCSHLLNALCNLPTSKSQYNQPVPVAQGFPNFFSLRTTLKARTFTAYHPEPTTLLYDPHNIKKLEHIIHVLQQLTFQGKNFR